MEYEYFVILDITIFILTILIHSCGTYILVKHKSLIARNQRLYLISLSTSEILLSLNHIVLDSAYLLTPLKRWVAVMEIVHYDALWLINLTTIIVLTLDRFAEVFYNIKYDLYVTHRRTMQLVISLWILGTLTAVLFTVLYLIYAINYFDITYRYIYPILDTAVVLNALIVYTYIYFKIALHNKRIRHINIHRQDISLPHQLNTDQSNKQKFFVPILIVISFVVFIYIPDVIHFANMHILNEKKWFRRVSTFLYSLNMLSDAAIYIFLQRNIRKFILKKLETNWRHIKLKWPYYS